MFFFQLCLLTLSATERQQRKRKSWAFFSSSSTRRRRLPFFPILNIKKERKRERESGGKERSNERKRRRDRSRSHSVAEVKRGRRKKALRGAPFVSKRALLHSARSPHVVVPRPLRARSPGEVGPALLAASRPRAQRRRRQRRRRCVFCFDDSNDVDGGQRQWRQRGLPRVPSHARYGWCGSLEASARSIGEIQSRLRLSSARLLHLDGLSTVEGRGSKRALLFFPSVFFFSSSIDPPPLTFFPPSFCHSSLSQTADPRPA